MVKSEAGHECRMKTFKPGSNWKWHLTRRKTSYLTLLPPAQICFTWMHLWWLWRDNDEVTAMWVKMIDRNMNSSIWKDVAAIWVKIWRQIDTWKSWYCEFLSEAWVKTWRHTNMEILVLQISIWSLISMWRQYGSKHGDIYEHRNLGIANFYLKFWSKYSDM